MNDMSAESVSSAPAGWVRFPIRDGFIGTNGPLFVRREEDALVLGLRVEERHCNPNKMCHGGMLMTFADMLLPIGALAAIPVATLSPVMIAGFLSFGLMALLYLVTEELLVEAHEKPDSPLISAMFFIGFLALLTLEEIMG